MGTTSQVVRAQTQGVVGLASQEVERRSRLVADQQARLADAEDLYQAKKAQEAYDAFLSIYKALPNVPLAAEARARALDGCLRAGTIRARELMDRGDYSAAAALLNTLDGADMAPGNRQVASLRKRMEDPDRYPPALTPGHIDRVAEVKRLLTLADSQRETGQYDAALQTFEDVLRLDPYNTAARRGMERTEQDRSRYLEAARDHARASMLNGASKLWEQPVPLTKSDISGMFGGTGSVAATPSGRGGRESLTQKLETLRVERTDFTDATLDEVLEYLKVRSRDLDPEKKGIDFVNTLSRDTVLRPVSLNVRDLPMQEILRYATEMAGVTYRVEDFAVRIVSLSEGGSTIISKSYRVPPGFISSAPISPDSAGNANDPFGGGGAAPGAASTIVVRRLGAKEFLESRGVSFPPDGGATYSPATNLLVVRTTAQNMALVDTLVDQSIGVTPKLVVVSVKMMEVNQNNLKELGFDWLVGGFGNNIEGAGGTNGYTSPPNFLTNDFPRQVTLPNGNQTGLGENPVTAGLRSSGDLIANQTIEDVLFGSVTAGSRRSPGVFSVAGVLTDPQFQGVVRALDQNTGIDLLVRPEVVTKSGQKATVQVIREMIYPTEFDPPQIPTNFGQNNQINNNPNLPVVPTSLPPAVATPATPTAFEKRDVGVTMEVEPVVSEDGRTVDLTVTPIVTDFVGFVNYGSPIRAVDPSGLGAPLEITENRIFQPIFSTKRVSTAVRVYDGSTVVLGGLLNDNTIIIDDKVPIFGDIPMVGRLFRSKVKQRRVRNMVFFVTCKVIDPGGNRINQN